MYLLVIVITLFGLLYYYLTRNYNYWTKRNVAGPKPLLLLGNLKNSILRRKPIHLVMKEIYDQYPNEKVVGIYRLTTPCLLIRDLNIIKQILIKDFDLFVERGIEFTDKGLGLNIFHADGERWGILRNRFSPLFTSRKLKNMLHLIIERGDKFIDYVESLCEKQPEQPVNILLQEFTMATIGACAFGIDLDKNMIKTLGTIDKLIFSLNYSRELEMMFPGILKKYNGSLFPNLVYKFFYNLAQRVIEQRGGIPTNRKDFMDLILELRLQKEIEGTRRQEEDKVKTLELTDSVIAAQSFIFYAAGYETSATTMTFMLYELAKNPEIQDKLIAEIEQVLNRHNGEMNYDILQEINYFDCVFNETLRKYPIIDPLQRRAQRNYTIPETNITIEKGQMVLISSWGIHKDPKIYPNPDKFDPERFNADNQKNQHSCAFLSFGAGPRNCIGMRFSRIQSRVCIIKLLSKFRVELSKNTQLNLEFDPMRIVLTPLGGIHLNIIRR